MGDRQFDIFDQFSGRTEAVDAAGGDATTPIAALGVRGAAIGPTPIGLHRREYFTRPDRSALGLIDVAKNRAAARIRVIHRTAVGTPRQTIGDFDVGCHTGAGMIRIQSIEAADCLLLPPLVHRVGPEATFRRDLAVIQAIGRALRLRTAEKLELLSL